MIYIDKLKVKYKDFVALDIDRSIKINRGDRVGVIGSNGAGKSTLIKALIGLIPYEGSFTIDALPNEISVHLQDNNYQDSVTVGEIIELILNKSIKNDVEINSIIDRFNFSHCLKKKFSRLSGGEKQMMTLIIIMARHSKLVFFDEVTTGLDFQNRERLIEMLSEWNRSKYETIVIVSHYYRELETLTDKLLILDGGKVVDYGETKKLFKKYCGNYVISVDLKDVWDEDEIYQCIEQRTDHTAIIFSKINSRLIISMDSKETLHEISDILIDIGKCFSVTDLDIELLSTIAKAKYKGKENIYELS